MSDTPAEASKKVSSNPPGRGSQNSAHGDALDQLQGMVDSLDESGENRREAFRVPLRYKNDLLAKIRKGDRIYSVTPTNVSITGIFVIPKQGEHRFELNQQEEVDVILSFERETYNYKAVVVRKQGNGYGLFFPESMQGEQVAPPRELVQLVMELQRRMIACQANSAFGI